MLNFKKSAVLAGLGLALATSAFAAPNSPYFRVDAGYVTNNAFSSADNVADQKFFNATVKKGKFGYGLGVGYQFDNNLRADVTFTMLGKNKTVFTATSALGNVTAGTANAGKTFADFSVNLLMANLYYDFADMNDSIVPYVTAGLGMGMVGKVNSYDFAGTATLVDDSKSKFAYSLGLGVASKINDNLTLDVGYKFTQVRTRGKDVTPAGTPATDPKSYDYLGYNYNNNAFMVGLRVSF